MQPLRTLSAFVFLALVTACADKSDIPLSATTKADQSSASALYNGSVAAENAGKTKRAIKGYRKVAKDYPLSTSAAEARFREASLLEKQNDLIDAFDAYDEILVKYPASSRYSSAIARQEAIAHAVAQGAIKNNFIGFKTQVETSKTTKMLAKVRDNAPRSPSASKAQFTIGEVHQNQGNADQAISAYRRLARDFPNAPQTPEALYRIGNILSNKLKDGNPNPANLDRAKEAYDDLLIRYPGSKQAKDARRELARLSSGDIQRSYDLAEHYRKKGQNTSAVFYYGEVVQESKPGQLRSQAEAWIKQLSAQ